MYFQLPFAIPANEGIQRLRWTGTWQNQLVSILGWGNLMIQMLSKRLAKAVRVLRLFTFSVAKLFMTRQQIVLREGMYAVERIQEGEHDEAIAILQRAIDSNPNNPILYHLYKLRGLAHFVQWKPCDAIEDFNRAITLGPYDSDPYVQEGNYPGHSPRIRESSRRLHCRDSGGP